ncbi:hypothetical protein CAPTEDRAFT_224050 [Capitella teleta]|uniref:Endonuclease/exonuclease/phosphatase domain-containing protein n=1 Tax=Capitella teleta TaxID=283909 RepID=R7T3I1_CAPTE|nr:hypothetical protein CAPTEDRAFT_224050 [Capitella teleta]|eukprot:ELT87238.1 hypothetical protein CAPTEDRAFT_224050 [Capitella teleta]
MPLNHPSETDNVTRVAVSSASFEVLECVIKSPIVRRICVVYQPYRTALFMGEFSSYLAGLTTSPGHLLVLGDFNLHVGDPLDKCAQDFLTFMSSLGHEQHVTTLTHRNGHTLDLVLTPLGNPLDLIWKSIDCGFPDHHALFVQVATSKPPLPRNDCNSTIVLGNKDLEQCMSKRISQLLKQPEKKTQKALLWQDK